MSARYRALEALAAEAWRRHANGVTALHLSPDERAVDAAVRADIDAMSPERRAWWFSRFRDPTPEALVQRFIVPAHVTMMSGVHHKGGGSDRVIHGVATTADVDRIGDVVLPEGVKFSLPLPLLWQHDHAQPVGQVLKANAKPGMGIDFTARLHESPTPGPLRERLEDAWESVKSGLVTGVSIGFRSLEAEPKRGGGLTIKRWEWLELSLVTIPANAYARITHA